ncbi:hypothetical protein FJM67_08135 [Maribrevibacterium harenarium]|uniref:Lipoprotein n=1 Tax=Maribrevibacterium harenarium TaxID=2589817 RepID=A0A501WR41_9GAMM|nr:hypothetical protein [Maribrevibacterium harenarium]TPE51939.1 hypothetical protein FJM67_08135 [Maribrevibacterium harenarium]
MNRSILTVFFSLLLTGCSLNDEQILAFGNAILLIFFLIVFLGRFAPRVQEIEVIKDFVKKLSSFLRKFSYLLIVLALFLFLFGGYQYFFEENKKLSVFFHVGLVLAYAAINIKKWCVESDVLVRRDLFRKIGLSLSFIVALIFLLMGAPGLSV